MQRLVSQIVLYGALALSALGALFARAPMVLVIVGALVVFVPLGLLTDRWFPPHERPRSRARHQMWTLLKYIGLLAMSLLYCVIGVVLLRRNWRISVVLLTFCGGCAIVFLSVVLRQLREWRLGSLGIESVRITGGVDIPLARGRLLAVGLGLTVGGVSPFAVGLDAPWALRISALFFASAGIALLAALPFMSRRRIRCDPEGLLIGELRFEYRIPWDEICGIGILEHQETNPLVILQLLDTERIAVTPPLRRGAFLKAVMRVRKWYGADVAIAARLFGLQAPLLAAAIGRYASDPDARRELAARLLEQK